VFLEAFEGPLDLLLYLIRKQNFNILDIPMAGVTRQYLSYVDEIRSRNLELAAEYLLMAAMLIEIKSRMLLPPKQDGRGPGARRPARRAGAPPAGIRADEAGRRTLNACRSGARLPARQVYIEQSLQPRFPDVSVVDLQEAWRDILKRAKLVQHHKITAKSCRCAST
jgi:segregation and condensation protein A